MVHWVMPGDDDDEDHRHQVVGQLRCPFRWNSALGESSLLFFFVAFFLQLLLVLLVGKYRTLGDLDIWLTS